MAADNHINGSGSHRVASIPMSDPVGILVEAGFLHDLIRQQGLEVRQAREASQVRTRPVRLLSYERSGRAWFLQGVRLA